jgi:hypothetical protein
MEPFAIFLLILGFVLAPAALVLVDRRTASGWARTFGIVAIFFSGIASIWAVRSMEVRWVAYYLRLEVGSALTEIQLALEQERTRQVQAVLVGHSRDGLHHAPTLGEIRSITEEVRAANKSGPANRSEPVQLGTNSTPLPAGSRR